MGQLTTRSKMLSCRVSTVYFVYFILFFATLEKSRIFILSRSHIPDCRTANIDLILMAGIDYSKNSTFLSEDSVSFLSTIPYIFLKEGEDDLKRVRVALAVWHNATSIGLFSFDDHDNIRDLAYNLSSYWSGLELDPFLLVVQSDRDRHDVFEIVGGARINVTQVIISVSPRFSYSTYCDDVLWSLNNGGPIRYKLCFHGGVYGSTSWIEVYKSNGEFSEHVYIPLFRGSAVSRYICNECQHGWFKFEPHNTNVLVFSCYHFAIHSKKTNWLDANIHCQGLQPKTGLVSIETEEELNFLRASVLKFFNSDKLQGIMPNPDRVMVVNIGIKRNEKTLDKRFRWVNGYPLVLTHWMPGHPDGGCNQGCGVWAFKGIAHRQNSTEGVLFDRYAELDSEGWMSVGCWDAVGVLSVCESFYYSFPSLEDYKRFVSNDKRISTRVQFNRYNYYYEALRSEKNFTFDPLYSAKWEMFDCGYKDAYINMRKDILFSSVCDHKKDCPDGIDERLCFYPKCSVDDFTCTNKQCIPSAQRCDLYPDCIDGSDEEDCTECIGKRCCDGRCLPKHWFHDGEIDCSCWSASINGQVIHDEWVKTLSDSRDNETCAFICNINECIFPSQLNDGVVDCTGPEGPLDERLGKLEAYGSCINGIGQFTWAPRCVYVMDRYNSALGCRDMSHLSHCDDFECPEGYFKCPRSYCIPFHYVYDGVTHCPIGEDEYFPRECPGYFRCFLSDTCLHPDLVCDRQRHCPHGDDELICTSSCMAGFRCGIGTVAVQDYNRSKPLQDLGFIDPQTRYLNLSGVDLSYVFPAYLPQSLVYLFEVRMSGCKIRNMPKLLDGHIWKTVVYLDLSQNLIRSITHPFSPQQNLRFLNLSYNQYLTIVNKRAFYDTINVLKVLDLSHTHILKLHGLQIRYIQHINLSHTKITKLQNQRDTTKGSTKEVKLKTLNLLHTPIIDFDPDFFANFQIDEGFYTDNYRLCCPQVRGDGIPAHVCHAPHDAISSCSDLIREPVQRILLWIMGVVAVLGNILVMLFRLIWDRSVFKRGYGLFVTNLGISDMIMGIYLLIIASVDESFRGRYVLEERAWKDDTVCQMEGFLSTFSSETSTFFIFLITLDRFLAIKYPFGQYRISHLGMGIATALAWAFGFVLAVIPLLPPLRHWETYRSNGMCLGLPLSSDRSEGWQYSFAVFVILNFVLFTIIALGQYAIYRAMSTNRVTKQTNFKVLSSIRRAQDIAVAKQLSLIVLSDFLCWFPVGVMGLMVVAGHEISNEAYAWSAALVLPVNSALNPVLYTVPVLLVKWEEFKTGRNGTKCETRTDDRHSAPITMVDRGTSPVNVVTGGSAPIKMVDAGTSPVRWSTDDLYSHAKWSSDIQSKLKWSAESQTQSKNC